MTALPTELTTFPEGFETVTSDSPGAGAAVQRAMAAAHESPVPLPEMTTAPDQITLPGGLVVDNETHRAAVVRELNGEDEEYLARAAQSRTQARYFQVLLERGVVRIGTLDATPERLLALTDGDRETLALGIRRMTYGDTVDIETKCPVCSVEATVRVSLVEDVPILPLKWDPATVYQGVALTSVNGEPNGEAEVRLITGADLLAVSTDDDMTMAEWNTRLLARVVRTLRGRQILSLTDAKQMSVHDRDTIRRWIAEHTFGPDYAIKHPCSVCGKEMPLLLTGAHLFPRQL